MKLTVVGCGDAFGSGGRLQTCFHVDTGRTRFLIDCGATALLGLDRVGLDPGQVETIVISHLHGDHFSGLVWWMVHGQHVGRRTTPLEVIGPPGIAARFEAAAEALFPGSTKVPRRFELTFRELAVGGEIGSNGFSVVPFEVSHPSGSLSAALRFDVEGRVIAFSGDTEWVDTLVDCANGADLFISECYGYERKVRYHLDWITLAANLERIKARRVLLSHMSHEMLANRDKINDPRVILAQDGLVIDV